MAARGSGTATSWLASSEGPGLWLILGQMYVNIFEKHSAFVHENTNCKGQPAKCHDVDRLTQRP